VSHVPEARDSEWQWHQLRHMKVCTLLQADNHASTPPLSFYRPDALPAAQPQHRSTVKKLKMLKILKYGKNKEPFTSAGNSVLWNVPSVL